MALLKFIVDFYKRPQPNEEELKKLIDHLIDNPSSGLQFVAEHDGKFLGFTTLYFSFSTLQIKKVAILNDLFVLQEARGEKLGEKLFQTCLSYIRENDFAYMTWETAKDNLVSQSLYKKMGGQLSEWLVYEIS
jgi:GNAT superfamily N-acetyltransferase